MKESLSSIFKAPIFRETFTDAASVLRNGGTATAVTFSNGVASFNGTSSKILYNKLYNGTYSVRLKFTSFTPVTNAYLTDFRSGTGYIICTSETVLGKSSGTSYIDGVASSTISTSTKEIVVTGMSISSVIQYVGVFTGGVANFLTAGLELIEIYEGTLTAEEVSNLYNNKRYVNPLLNHSQVLSSTDVNAGYDFNTWTPVNATVDNATTFTSSANGGVFKTLLTIGKRYRLIINGTTTASGFVLFNSNSAANSIATAFGTIDFTAINASLYFRNTGVGTTNITTWSIKEITQDAINEVLVIDAKKGFIENKYGTAIVNTATTLSKSGSIYAMDFNGTTSKIDAGSYDSLVGDKTFIAWIKPRGWGESGFGRVMENGKLLIFLNPANSYIGITSDGSTNIYASNNSIKLSSWQLIVATRTSNGNTNWYINGATSGTAHQYTGVPTAGTTNITIGNSSNAINTFDGLINGARVVNGILSVAEISNLFSTERKFYNI